MTKPLMGQILSYHFSLHNHAYTLYSIKWYSLHIIKYNQKKTAMFFPTIGVSLSMYKVTKALMLSLTAIQ